MSTKRIIRTAVMAGAAVSAAALLALVPLAGLASAASGPSVTLSPAPVGSPIGNIPDQTTLSISIGANSTFAPGTKVNILECADPGGSPANLPTDLSSCDGNTIQGDTIIVQSDGSISYNDYTLYQLPSPVLDEPPSNFPVCNSTNACVLFIAQDQNDFTQPKTFSSPFYVAPYPQTITFTSTPPSPAYVNGTYTAVATGGGSGNPVVFSSATTSVCTVSGSTVSLVGAGPCTIDANEAGANNAAGGVEYSPAPQVSQSFTVSGSPQTITFTSTPPIPAYVNGTYTAVATGGGSGNPVVFSSATTSVCTVSGSTVSLVGAGTCTIDANQAGNTAYSAAPTAAQSFTVGLNPQKITFTSTPPSPAYVTGTYTAAATGGGSGNPVVYSSATTSVCTVSGSTVSLVGAGTCTIDANQAGNTAYSAAPTATESFTVGKIGTNLVASPAKATENVLNWSATFSAKLTSRLTGAPVAGQTVSFTASGLLSTVLGSESCSAVTNSSGVATCTITGLLLEPIDGGSTYSASYGGSTAYMASSATGSLGS